MKRISILILILAIFTSCAPRYIIPLNEEQAEKFVEIGKMISNLYQISPTGEAHFSGGYIAWDEKGVRVFIKK